MAILPIFFKKNTIIRIFSIPERLTLPINPDKGIYTVHAKLSLFLFIRGSVISVCCADSASALYASTSLDLFHIFCLLSGLYH